MDKPELCSLRPGRMAKPGQLISKQRGAVCGAGRRGPIGPYTQAGIVGLGLPNAHCK